MGIFLAVAGTVCVIVGWCMFQTKLDMQHSHSQMGCVMNQDTIGLIGMGLMVLGVVLWFIV